MRCSDLSDKFSNLVELLRYRALTQPDKIAYTFLEKGEKKTDLLTYEVLDQRSRAIACQLQSLGATGERALLVYPPGVALSSIQLWLSSISLLPINAIATKACTGLNQP